MIEWLLIITFHMPHGRLEHLRSWHPSAEACIAAAQTETLHRNVEAEFSCEQLYRDRGT
jgi:hypothetical protein